MDSRKSLGMSERSHKLNASVKAQGTVNIVAFNRPIEEGFNRDWYFNIMCILGQLEYVVIRMVFDVNRKVHSFYLCCSGLTSRFTVDR